MLPYLAASSAESFDHFAIQAEGVGRFGTIVGSDDCRTRLSCRHGEVASAESGKGVMDVAC